MITITLDEELLTALVFAAAQSSCVFNRNTLQENQLWHLHCCDYNEPDRSLGDRYAEEIAELKKELAACYREK